MIQRLGLALAVAFTLAACGAGEQPDAGAEQTAAAPAQPTTQAPAETAPANAGAGTSRRPAARPAAEVRPAGALYTVQIAAYEQTEGAARLATLLTQRGLPAWTTTTQVDGRTYHRVRIGALPDLAATRRLGREIAREYNADVWIAPIGAGESIPAGAVDATRALVPGR